MFAKGVYTSMRYAYKQQLKYINWRKEGTLKNLKNEDFKNKLEELRSLGGMPTATQTTRLEFVNHNYRLDLKGSYRYLYTRENSQYIIYTTNILDDNKNTGMINHSGRISITTLQKEFKNKNGCTFRKAFGYTPEDYKRCIPKSFVYLNLKCCGMIMQRVSAIDGCSQYPSSLCGDLPDAHDCQFYDGTVKPTAEYPFAFYLNSGHIAQYRVFDTHNWLKNYFYRFLFNFDIFNDKIKPEEDQTVLMAKSPFNFNDIMRKYYEQRKTDPDAKMILNSTIGYFHTKNYKEFQLAHLAAVTIARSNQKMLDMIDKIGINRIIQVVVDGIMYTGTQQFGLEEKKFGTFHQEFISCKAYIRGMNAYIVMDRDKVIKARHGAYNKNKDGTPIIEENIKGFEDANNWIKQDYFEEMRKEKFYGKEVKNSIQCGWYNEDRSANEEEL